MARHRWTFEDKCLAVLLYRLNIISESDIERWCRHNGFDAVNREISIPSLFLEIQAVKFLDTGKGFDAASSLLEDAYRKHRLTPIEELKRIAM
jgi:hypothetical protein